MIRTPIFLVLFLAPVFVPLAEVALNPFTHPRSRSRFLAGDPTSVASAFTISAILIWYSPSGLSSASPRGESWIGKSTNDRKRARDFHGKGSLRTGQVGPEAGSGVHSGSVPRHRRQAIRPYGQESHLASQYHGAEVRQKAHESAALRHGRRIP